MDNWLNLNKRTCLASETNHEPLEDYATCNFCYPSSRMGPSYD